MCAQGFDRVEGSEAPTAFEGALEFLGARAVSAEIFFGVYLPYAESVHLVGSFNSWSDTCPMERGEDGIWRARLPASLISEGTPYKYKVTRGGESVYLTDPYTKRTEGAPHYNSVYCAPPKRTKKITAAHADGALTVYEINARNFILGQGGALPDYAFLAKELIPYVLQMGYTHISLTGIFEEYYDHGSSRTAHAYFSAEPRQGGIRSLCCLVRMMQSLGVGVLFELGIEKSFGERRIDLSFYTECALYWLDACSADGLIMRSDGLHDDEFFRTLSHNVKRGRRDALLLAVAGEGEAFGTDAVISDCERYIDLFPRANTQECELRIRAAAVAYLLFNDGKMLTSMGQEAGSFACPDGCFFDRAVLERKPNAIFQLFLSELNNIYLENYELFRSCDTLSVERESGVKIMKRSCMGEELILAIDMSGEGGELSLDESGEWERRICFDGHTRSFSAIYTAGGRIHATLPPYGIALFERIM